MSLQPGTTVLRRLARICGWLVGREELPPTPAPAGPVRPRERSWAATLLGSETLPEEPQPPGGRRERGLGLWWLVEPEELPAPQPPAAVGDDVPGVLRWLLASERLPEPVAPAAHEGEEHGQGH